MHPAVDLYLESQPAASQKLLAAARRHLLLLDDRVREDFKWRVPFYHYYGLWCYLTTVPRKSYIHLAFLYGHLLAAPPGLLTGTDRKMVRYLRLTTVADLHEPAVLELLQQTLLIQEERATHRRQKQ